MNLTAADQQTVRERKARRTRIMALTLDATRREELVLKAVQQAEAPKPDFLPDFDRTAIVYAGREICPCYFEGEERRIRNREKVYDRDERDHVTRFDTFKQFVNPLSLWRQTRVGEVQPPSMIGRSLKQQKQGIHTGKNQTEQQAE